MELWGAIDYLMRTGQAGQAVPYLDKLMAGPLGDEDLIRIRDRFGGGSILRLADDPATQSYAEPLLDKLTLASRRFATDPQRIARLIPLLTRTKEEQDFAVARLREAGPHAVPFLIEALDRAGATPQERSLLAMNLGRLDRTAVPALIPVLQSADSRLATIVATALGAIGDPRAIPVLTYFAARSDSAPTLRAACREAIERLTGLAFDSQPRPPVRVLTDAAWSIHRREVEFPGEEVILWVWDENRRAPLAQQVSRSKAEETLGLDLAQKALRLAPDDLEAQAVMQSLALEKTVEQLGYEAFAERGQEAFSAAVASGPTILTEILKRAIADGKTELAAVAATALAQVVDRAELATGGRPHPLVDAVGSPGRRLQFAAAKALVGLSPSQPFPGSSRIVPTLARFLVSEGPPRAVVIDSNSARGSQLAGFLQTLGYRPTLELEGVRGFEAAAEAADVELVLVSYDLFQGSWNLTDTLTNLRSDSRTAQLPLYVYGPRQLEHTRPQLLAAHPGVKFLVQPVDAPTLERLLGSKPVRLSKAERSGYAKQAADLLALIASQPNNPLAADLQSVEPALTEALLRPSTGVAAAQALAEVPSPSAQRGLADVVLDPSRDAELRRTAAACLARSIQRYGPLVSADQETRLLAEFQAEPDASLRAALGAVVGTLRAQVQNSLRRPPTAGASKPAPARLDSRP
jgi:hypothetical protein